MTARVKIPMLARGNELITKTGKFGEAIRMCQDIESSAGGIAAGVNIGNPFTDVPDLRSNTIVTVDGDRERAEEEALKLARFHVGQSQPVVRGSDADERDRRAGRNEGRPDRVRGSGGFHGVGILR